MAETATKAVNTIIPQAKKNPHTTEMFGEKLVDNYHWLRDDKWPNVADKDVLDYLNQENAYHKHIMSDYEQIHDQLFEEMKARVREDDESVPIKRDDYYYYSFIKKGMDYWVHVRKKGNLAAPEELLVDENELAKGKEYMRLGTVAISPNHNLMAYSFDDSGDERYDIHIKDMTTGKHLKDVVSNTFGNVVWHENGEGFFYTPASKNWRAEQIKYHHLGDNPANDKIIYQEDDNTFRARISKSRDKKFLFVESRSSTSNEYFYVEMSDPDMSLHLIQSRREEHLFDVEHHDGHFYISTNDRGRNFRLIKIAVGEQDFDQGEEIEACDEQVYLTDFDVYKNHLVVEKKVDGLPQISFTNFTSGEKKLIEFPSFSFAAQVSYTTYEDTALRFVFSSPKTPTTTREIDFVTGEDRILKEDVIPSGYNHDLYETLRTHAISRDGTKIPLTILYRRDLRTEDNPVYLYGYGSYGIAAPVSFRKSIFSLVDRGFIYAVAHIRGGDDLGFKWYEDAKFLNKRRTFEDFIACAEHLIEEKYTSKGNIVIAGGSAGGMLVGATMNMATDLYKAVVAHVPFVDVLNTMLDENLPLTPGEFKEWGNPKYEEFFRYILSYSPYDNVEAKPYPHIFVTAGLTDPRVTYWEPAKWVAKLRELKTNDNLLLFKTNMDAGHGGASGRFDYLKEVADEYAFIMKVYGLKA
jgi:oligopeptidase B